MDMTELEKVLTIKQVELNMHRDAILKAAFDFADIIQSKIRGPDEVLDVIMGQLYVLNNSIAESKNKYDEIIIDCKDIIRSEIHKQFNLKCLPEIKK